MGGGEILTLASDPKYEDLMPSIRGWLTEAAFLAFPKGFEPPALKVVIGRLAGRVLPKLQLHGGLPPPNLTRDPETIKSMEQDKLLHGNGTLKGLADFLDRSAALHNGETKLNKGVRSLWISHGTEDKGASFDASKKWFEEQTQVKDKEFKVYDGWYHQLHADLPEDRPIFAKDVGDWIIARLGPEEPRQLSDSKL